MKKFFVLFTVLICLCGCAANSTNVTGGYWKSPGSDMIEDIVFSDKKLTVSGWHKTGNEWSDETISRTISEDCIYIDGFTDKGEVSRKEFEKILQAPEYGGSVIQFKEVNGTVCEISVVEVDESIFAE